MKLNDTLNTKHMFSNTHNSHCNKQQQQQHEILLQRHQQQQQPYQQQQQKQQHYQLQPQQHQQQPPYQLQRQPQQLQKSQQLMQKQNQQQQQSQKYKGGNKVIRKTSDLGKPRYIFNNLSKVFKPSSINNTTNKQRGHREKITNGLYTVERVKLNLFGINLKPCSIFQST